MRVSRGIIAGLLGLTIATAATADGHGSTRDAVAAALASEKAGFNARDCDAALAHWSDDELLMVVNTRVIARSKPEMADHCARIMERMPPGMDNRQFSAENIVVLSPAAAYSITEYPDGAIVTKVWRKEKAGWRIVHVHESLNMPQRPQ